MLTGMAFSSVFMHKNSPVTHIRVMHTMFITHQLRLAAKWPLYNQQKITWKKWTVQVKSRQSFVRWTTYQRAKALEYKEESNS